MKKMTLAEKIDALYTLRANRLVGEKRIKELKTAEDDLHLEVMALVRNTPDSFATGRIGKAKINVTVVPQITDAEAFFAWGRKKANRDVMNVSVALDPWRAFRAEGINADGVEAFTKETLSVTKV